MKHNNTTEGFTVIEVIMTLVIGVVFLLAINTLFITVIRSTTAARNRADASTLAYSYLRKYAYAGAPYDWFQCNGTSNGASAPGQSLDNGSLDATQTTLPQPVNYTISVIAPYGCDPTTNTTSPLLVRSTVTYGPDNTSINHATYIQRLQ